MNRQFADFDDEKYPKHPAWRSRRTEKAVIVQDGWLHDVVLLKGLR